MGPARQFAAGDSQIGTPFANKPQAHRVAEARFMSYVLLTGATGLVGHYLLRDLLLADVRVAVIGRPTRAESVQQRLEAIMRRWEDAAGRALPRPVVIQGELNREGLGISTADVRWLAENCESVLHNAASMVFKEDKHGEPFRTNVEGLKNLLGVCRQAGIRKLHHVSTAYVCGLRQGRILESELDLGQQNGNVYERSKLQAEKLVRAADFDELTVYRPASVIGDTRTGFTTSTHGFYLPLQLAYMIAERVSAGAMGERFLKLLGLTGDEGKNLVPVDWLSAAITYLVTHPEHHGQTYHLTHPQPVPSRLIQQVVREAIERWVPDARKGPMPEEELAPFEKLFREHMEVYRSHWRDDPQFDRTNTDRVLGDRLPVPQLDHDTLLRIAAYPVQKKFVLRRAEPIEDRYIPQQRLATWLASNAARHSGAAVARSLGLQINGRGGGQWRLLVDGNRVIGADLGLGKNDAARFYLSAQTFSSLVEGRLTVRQSIDSGRVVIEAAGGGQHDLAGYLEQIVAPC
jgi:thioester reductase-like protein